MTKRPHIDRVLASGWQRGCIKVFRPVGEFPPYHQTSGWHKFVRRLKPSDDPLQHALFVPHKNVSLDGWFETTTGFGRGANQPLTPFDIYNALRPYRREAIGLIAVKVWFPHIHPVVYFQNEADAVSHRMSVLEGNA